MLGSKEMGNIHFWGGHEKMFYKDDIWIWETMGIFISKDKYKGIPSRETILVWAWLCERANGSKAEMYAEYIG